MTHLTILDPGLCYRGAAADAEGPAATCGRRTEAADLLAAGLPHHLQHGSPWMASPSEDALGRLTGRR
jgi:hypothetical protein